MKRIFISYSHEDEKWKERVYSFLKVFEMQGLWEVWHDRRIRMGEDWHPNIKRAINNADAAILLISVDFLTSDFIQKEEIPALLQRRVEEKIGIFPLIIRGSPWTGIDWLASIQVYPPDGEPLSGFRRHNIDSILTDFVMKIKDILTQAIPEKAIVKKKREKIALSLSKLPKAGSLLLGREKELEVLDRAWEDPDTFILSLEARGGIGKTALVNEWLKHMAAENYRGAERVYGWSFCSQGTSEDRQTSSDDFIDNALEWFGDPAPKQGSPWNKGERLATLIRQKKTLLILDGMESLQYPPGEMQGYIKDQSLQALLKELARSNPGLCVVTTRLKVKDIDHEIIRSVRGIYLEHLSPEVGAALLKKLGVIGTDAELQRVSEEFRGHALALNLLGRYLAVVHDGNIRRRDFVHRLTEEEEEGGHARRVMESYEKFLTGKPELNILYILGLFVRPAEGGAIDALRAEPAIKGLTDDLKNLSEAKWKFVLKNLRDLNLLSEKDVHRPDTLDCHPLVREHFSEKLHQNNPKAWKEAHSRLYEYYKNLPEKKFPDTLKEMEPLYTAVYHGCKAGRHQEVMEKVFYIRIRRKDKAFSLKILGAFGSDLAVLSGFFRIPWSQPVLDLEEDRKGFIFNEAGFILQALGRLREAVQPMQAALEARIMQRDWKNAAINSGNLSELYLTLGEVAQAITTAQQSVEFADRSQVHYQRIKKRKTLANSLFQAGKVNEVEHLFHEAETIRKNDLTKHTSIYLLQSFWFCNLLLSQGKYLEVQNRAKQTLESGEQGGLDLLTHALFKLSLGRAHWLQIIDEDKGNFTIALDYLNQAVDDFRDAGYQDELPRGLLARTALFRTIKEYSKAWDDLNEAYEIAARGRMNLYLADYHLEAARLCLAEGKKNDAETHLATAREMINKMGYYRRDKEVEEIEGQLAVGKR